MPAMEQVDFSHACLRQPGWGDLADVLLVVMSVWCIAILITRILVFRRWRGQSSEAMVEALRRLEQNDWEGDVAPGRKNRGTHPARIVGTAISVAMHDLRRGLSCDLEAVAHAAEEERARVSLEVRRPMRTLATIAVTAPLLGFWGTLVEMADVFDDLAATGSGGLAAVAGSIAEALGPTAFGVFLAIAGAWAARDLDGRIDEVQRDAEALEQAIVDRLRMNQPGIRSR